MSYRQLDEEEEKLEETVMMMWDDFLVVVQDAIDFVNVQTPLIIQNIEDLYLVSSNSSAIERVRSALLAIVCDNYTMYSCGMLVC